MGRSVVIYCFAILCAIAIVDGNGLHKALHELDADAQLLVRGLALYISNMKSTIKEDISKEKSDTISKAIAENLDAIKLKEAEALSQGKNISDCHDDARSKTAEEGLTAINDAMPCVESYLSILSTVVQNITAIKEAAENTAKEIRAALIECSQGSLPSQAAKSCSDNHVAHFIPTLNNLKYNSYSAMRTGHSELMQSLAETKECFKKASEALKENLKHLMDGVESCVENV